MPDDTFAVSTLKFHLVNPPATPPLVLGAQGGDILAKLTTVVHDELGTTNLRASELFLDLPIATQLRARVTMVTNDAGKLDAPMVAPGLGKLRDAMVTTLVAYVGAAGLTAQDIPAQSEAKLEDVALAAAKKAAAPKPPRELTAQEKRTAAYVAVFLGLVLFLFVLAIATKIGP